MHAIDVILGLHGTLSCIIMFVMNMVARKIAVMHPAPGQPLLLAVRAGFVSQGTTLSAWCKHNQIKLPNARVCLLGGWNGPAAHILRARIIVASGANTADRRVPA